MLARRVIICLQFDEGVLHRTKRFKADYRYCQAHCVAGDADELVLLDITRSGPWPAFPDLVERYCRRIDTPCAAGGHVRSWDYAKQLLNSGCEKVIVGWGGKDCYEEIASRVGRQSLVAGIDFKGGEVWENRNRDHAGQDVPECCRISAERGAGEILLTSIDRDGSLSGFDLSTLQIVVGHVSVPVVVAGGCGGWQHMREAFDAGAAGAVTSNIFHQNETAMRGFKQQLVAQGCHVRPPV